MLQYVLCLFALNVGAPNEMVLNKDLVLTEAIKVTEDLTIQGNGHFIDAQGLDCVFYVEKGITLTLVEVRFKNIKHFANNKGKIELVNSSGKLRKFKSTWN